MAGVDDADGDGRGDLLIGAHTEAVGSPPNYVGRAYLFSGATGELLHTLDSTNPQIDGRFGQSVSGVPDADGDGGGDLLVGQAAHISWGERPQLAFLFSGGTGELLHVLESPNHEIGGEFGAFVAGVDDVNGDGRGDLFVGAPEEDGKPAGLEGAGRAYLFSGSTGALLRVFTSPAPEAGGNFGRSLSGIDDVDGDG